MEPGKQEPQAQWNFDYATASLASIADERESRAGSAEQVLEQQREALVENLKRARDMIQSRIDSILANQHEGENSLSIAELEAQLGAIDGSISFAQTASLSQLPAIIVQATAMIGAAVQSVNSAVALASFESGHFMHELTEAKMQAFTAYVDTHGFAAALDEYDFSYENSGLAFEYLRRNDPEFGANMDRIDHAINASLERVEALDGRMDTITDQLAPYMSDEDRDALEANDRRRAELRAQAEAAEAAGQLNIADDRRVEWVIATAERQDILQGILDDPNTPPEVRAATQTEMDAIGTELQAEYDTLMAQRDERQRLFIAELEERGVDPARIARYEERYATETARLEGMGVTTETLASINAAIDDRERRNDLDLALLPTPAVIEDSPEPAPANTPETSETPAVPAVAAYTDRSNYGALAGGAPFGYLGRTASIEIAQADALQVTAGINSVSGGQDVSEISAPASGGGIGADTPATSISGGTDVAEAAAPVQTNPLPQTERTTGIA